VVEKFWFNKSDEFYSIAKEMAERGHYWFSCFASQQSVEFLLKGIEMKYTGTHTFTHDLSELLQKVEKILGVKATEEVYQACDFLTPHYTISRYSMVTSYDKRKALECIKMSEIVRNWVNSQIKP
jgi:Uncharacterized conserved protein related to C-terminal domain of eukaryotic chaperone, SACSIN